MTKTTFLGILSLFALCICFPHTSIAKTTVVDLNNYEFATNSNKGTSYFMLAGANITDEISDGIPSLLSATTSQTNVACNGSSTGLAGVTVSGGTAPYFYLWSNGGTSSTESGLAAGTYTCTITDSNDDSITKSFTITEPSALVAVPSSQNNVSCFGGNNGTATVSVSGGAGGYTYSWSPSGGTAATASGLSAATYVVTVTDANSCTTTQSFTVTQSSAIAATPSSQTNVSCFGGSNGAATVSVSGGAGGYTYSWSPSGGTAATASGLSAATYVVTVTDANSCTTTRSFTVTQPSAIITTAAAQTNVSCNGGSNGSATIGVSGGAGGYTYSWLPLGGTAATASGLTAGTYTVTVTDANSCTATRNFTITQPSAIITTAAAQTNVSCNGGSNGSATVNVSGGTSGYTYSWSPSGGTAATASGLTAGTYTVTVTDANSCTATQNFTITEPSMIVTTGSQNNVSCNGASNGSATVNVSGGTSGYTYSWSPSGGTSATASGLLAGTYTVTVTDANSCTATQSFTITQPSVLVLNAVSQTNIACNGSSTGSATVTTTGGAGDYTYSWSPSGGTAATASGLTAGTYTVTVTDANSCTATQNFTITEPSMIVTTGSQNNVSCNGASNGSATVNVSGGTSGYTYSWSPSGGTAATASGLTAGTYTVTVTDANSCTATQNFTITEPSMIVTTGSQTNVSCNGASNGSATVNVSGGTSGYTYSWSPSGGTAATASGLTAGTYTVTVTDANSCTATQNFTITEPTAIAITASQSNLSCNVEDSGSATVEVTGGTGSYTYSWSPSGGTAATASELTAGTYTVTVTDANSCTSTHVFVLISEEDSTPPTAVSQDITVVLIEGEVTITANQVDNGSSDNCGISSITVSPDSFDCNDLGTNTVTLTVTDNNENSVTSTSTVTVTDPDGYCALSAGQFVKNITTVYPNPTLGLLQLTISNGAALKEATVLSVTGQVMRAAISKKEGNSYQLDLSQFPTGVYLVKITTDKGTEMKRIIKN